MGSRPGVHFRGRNRRDPALAPPEPSTASSATGPEPFSSVDFAWLRMDDPTNLMLIHGVLVLAAPVALARVREIVEQRMVPIARFRQRVVVPARGRPRWEPAVGFD